VIVRFSTAYDSTSNDGGNPSIDLSYNTDRTIDVWRVRRRSSTQDINMTSRTYSYYNDGQVKGWSTGVTADPARTFFWDGANRLTCAAAASGAGTCPTGSTLLESYTYDLHENRATMNDLASSRDSNHSRPAGTQSEKPSSRRHVLTLRSLRERVCWFAWRHQLGSHLDEAPSRP